MGRRVEMQPPAAVLDKRSAARVGWQLARRVALEVAERDAPPFTDQPGVAQRLAAARAEPDPFRRLELLQALRDEQLAWHHAHNFATNRPALHEARRG